MDLLTDLQGEFWFTEPHTPNAGLTLKVKKQLYHRQSEYQLVEMFQTYDFGIMMTIDKLVMLTERDEAAYHEMIVHVPALMHPAPKTALVVGGGDGGTLRELIRHPSIERAVQVEIDEAVVEASRRHFPWAEEVYQNSRVELIIDDALKYVKETRDRFDIVVVDSTDPVGPAVKLFEENFYSNVRDCLTENGLMSCQIGAPFYHLEHVQETLETIRRVFGNGELYLAHMPGYPSGLWSLGLASKQLPLDTPPDLQRLKAMIGDLRYYNEDLHSGAFALPQYVRKQVKL
ncbi:polyamine aminopropyltransferase [Calditrichota bacterium]